MNKIIFNKTRFGSFLILIGVLLSLWINYYYQNFDDAGLYIFLYPFFFSVSFCLYLKFHSKIDTSKKIFVDTFILLQYLSLLLALVSSFGRYGVNGFFERGVWIVIYYLIFNTIGSISILISILFMKLFFRKN
jgi:hypothetical protein